LFLSLASSLPLGLDTNMHLSCATNRIEECDLSHMATDIKSRTTGLLCDILIIQ